MQPDSSPNDSPVLNVVGEKVALGPRRLDLVPLYHRWINDLDVTRTYGWRVSVRTHEWVEEWYDRGSKGGPDFVDFTVYEQATLRPIGWTSLEEIDYFDRTAKFIILIGEKDCWGKGYGTEATRLTLDYGFTVLGLHNIWLTVNSHNERGIRAYRRAGFREAGRRREAHRLAGQAYDVIFMDCLATEFPSPRLHQLLPVAEGTRAGRISTEITDQDGPVQIREFEDAYREQLVRLYEDFQDYLADLDPLRRLRRQLGFGAAALDKDLMQVAEHRGRFLLALDRDRVVAFATSVVVTLAGDDLLGAIPSTFGRVTELYVHPGYRRRGIGTLLMRRMEGHFRDAGCAVAKVEVFAPNEPARRLYRKLGYELRDIDTIKSLQNVIQG